MLCQLVNWVGKCVTVYYSMWQDIPEDLILQVLPIHAENFLLHQSSDFYVIVCQILKLVKFTKLGRLWCLPHFLCAELDVHARMNPCLCLPYVVFSFWNEDWHKYL